MSAQLNDEVIDAVTPRPDVVHQALRREVNERARIVDDGHAGGRDAMHVMCECGHSSCTRLISMTIAEYESVRRFPTRFFVSEGHAISDGDRVVASLGRYVVTEKSGSEALYAVGADPRTRGLQVVEAGR